MIEINSVVIAPYVTSNLATFYETCFVHINTATPLMSVATALLDITAYELTTVQPFTVCTSNDGYHPIVVKLHVPTNAPAL